VAEERMRTMLKTQKVVIALSAFSLASSIVILGVYIDFRRAVMNLADGDWPAYLDLSNSHPGGALNALLGNTLHYLKVGNSVLHSSVEFYLSLLLAIALFCLPGFYIYRVFRADAHNPLFVISAILNGMFHIVIQWGLLNIYAECYPNPRDWCGLLGGIAIALVSEWFFFASVLLLMIDGYKNYRNAKA
jgi:hypothetical protein